MNSAVLYDAPGPKMRRISRMVSIVGLLAIAGGIAWLLATLAAPRETQPGIVQPGLFDSSRWNIFYEPFRGYSPVQVWNGILSGLLATFGAAVVAGILAMCLGLVICLLRLAKGKWLRVPTTILLEFVRGMPVLLMMLFILLVFGMSTFWVVVAALAIYNGAIIGEAIRAGIQSLPRGQREAGLSLGLSSLQVRLIVELPQALRQMTPIIVAQLVVLLKDTSLAYIIGYEDLLKKVTNLSNFYGDRYFFSVFFVALVAYLIVNLSLSWFAWYLSRHVR
ncbi:MAG TPA: amino acid ABC transporter permease [Terrimicrobiaceae bacterium]